MIGWACSSKRSSSKAAPDLADPGDLLDLVAERGLSGPAVGDVDHLPEQDVDRAVDIADRRDVQRRPDLRAVRSEVPLLRHVVLQRRAGELLRADLVGDKVVRVAQIGEGQREQRFARPAHELAERVVDAQVAQRPGIDERHPDRSVVEALPEALLGLSQLLLALERERALLLALGDVLRDGIERAVRARAQHSTTTTGTSRPSRGTD